MPTMAVSSCLAPPHARVAAVVVTYFPQERLLYRLVSSIADQVDVILLIDNTPGSQAQDPRSALPSCRDLRYLPQGRNLGVASAFNVGIEVVLKADYTHIMMFDQDSMLPAGGVKNLLHAEQCLLDQGRRVAAVAPLYVDEKSGKRVTRVFCKGFKVHRIPIASTEENPVETDSVISSGALIKTSILRQVGPMLDLLFIDFVDTEWAYRASALGLCCYIVPQVIMTHSIGDHAKTLMGKTFYLHSATRDYYIVRNTIYLLRGNRMSRDWRLANLVALPKYIISRLLLAPGKMKRFFLMLRAFYQGTAGSMRNLM
ncbi:MAG TPA: glycosyltransferase family 2 protein [Terracidiphilus sp.]|nr:glycosyltransferase family 2 protein [Terracidiphilus sp.]